MEPNLNILSPSLNQGLAVADNFTDQAQQED
jgi:hypothetical protein